MNASKESDTSNAMLFITLMKGTDLNEVRKSGFYRSAGAAAIHSPDDNMTDWTLFVLPSTSAASLHLITQTFYSGDQVWHRDCQSNGEVWSAWKNLFHHSPRISLLSPSPGNDLNTLRKPGFYHSTGLEPEHAPLPGVDWLVHISPPLSFNPSLVIQTYYSGTHSWIRSSQDGGDVWSEWTPTDRDASDMKIYRSGGGNLKNYTKNAYYTWNNNVALGAPDGYRSDEWTLLVFNNVYNGNHFILQTFYSYDGVWWRKSSNNAADWSPWFKSETASSSMDWRNGTPDSYPEQNQLGFLRNHNNNEVILSMVTQLYSTTLFEAIQYRYTTQNLQWRGKTLEGGTFKEWRTLSQRPAMGSAYLLGTAIIPVNGLIPFAHTGAMRDCQLDAVTGELIINQGGSYSLSSNLILPRNQEALFVISIDGRAAGNHTGLHCQASSSQGFIYATLTHTFECTEGQRIGIKNITGTPVTLWPSVNNRKSRHGLTLTPLES
ncbi:hypothetical protein HQN87_03230 [Paenibacillus tritici]|uniref:Uncharacterized protein n=1 Tax=Paenibacillus tritici TaxID=1873425 RepID=A0ABX2DI87_9BACL|nr:pyocin knob domain-containing protein [Paenibacillus tritici]NQX44334.1 hypothetical protein [Paenibacillus tritici]